MALPVLCVMVKSEIIGITGVKASNSGTDLTFPSGFRTTEALNTTDWLPKGTSFG